MNKKKIYLTLSLTCLFLIILFSLLVINYFNQDKKTYGTIITIEELNSDEYKDFIKDNIKSLIKECNCDSLNDFKSLNKDYYYNFIYDVVFDTVFLNYIDYQLNTNLFNDYVKDHLTNEISGRSYYGKTEFDDYYLSLWGEKQSDYYEPWIGGIGLSTFVLSPKNLTYYNNLYTYTVNIGLTEDSKSYNFENNLEGTIKFEYKNNKYKLTSFIINKK